VSDEAALLQRQAAYIDSLRGLYRSERTAGLVACLVGVILMSLARFRFSGEPALLWSGVGVIALGWGLFAYAILRRRLWVRAHPFDANG